MIEIVVNQTPVKLVAPCSINDALAAVVDSTDGMALAVNGEVVRKPEWPTYQLDHGDQIHLFRAVAGG